MSKQWWEELKAVKWDGVYGRIIGGVDGCAVMGGVPAKVFLATPGGSVVVAGRSWFTELISNGDIAVLKGYEEQSAGEDIYGGPDVLAIANEKHLKKSQG